MSTNPTPVDELVERLTEICRLLGPLQGRVDVTRAHTIDIITRKDAKERRYEGDWIAQAVTAIPEAAVQLTIYARRVAELDLECERAWEAYKIAHGQAMANGDALAQANAEIAALNTKETDRGE